MVSVLVFIVIMAPGEVQYNIINNPGAEVLRLPGGRLVSFPFLENVNADAVLLNADAVIESILFDSPQSIPLENIDCPQRLGRLNGEILTHEIAVCAEEQYYLIHLVKPVEIITRFLGVISVRTLEIGVANKLTGFIRSSVPL